MPDLHKHEKRFLSALQDIFVGAKIEGDSGYVNLMRIKSRYYEKGVFPQLQKDIAAALEHFPDFREEMFDKLHTFFQRYFSESGSIYFRYTPLHQRVYEQVYTDDRDVVLFWKTHMLYYVKTDRIFSSLKVEVDGQAFFFDASGMNHKKANEKRAVVFTFRNLQDGVLVFDVAYSERGRSTQLDVMLKEIKKAGVALEEDTLNRSFRVFEKQSEVDYFINKDAKAFLEEQFELWLYQYLFAGQNIWDAERLAQLQALRSIAFKVITFISQFEDELVRIWNKPKFVLGSHYLVTLDHLTVGLLEQVSSHQNFQVQIEEWRSLGMLEDDFHPDMLFELDQLGAKAHPHLQYLPLDTRHFPELELEVLERFEDLDTALNGWVVRSENYQALNTILPKFNNRLQAIYIDPPYNTKGSEITYLNDFKSSSWLSLFENRFLTALPMLKKAGVFCIAIDDSEYSRLRDFLCGTLTDNLLLGTAAVRSNPSGRSTMKGMSVAHDYAIFGGRTDDGRIGRLPRTQNQLARYKEQDEISSYEWVNFRKHGGAAAHRSARPKMFYPIYSDPEGNFRIPEMEWIVEILEWRILDEPHKNEVVILPIGEGNEEKRWKWGHESVLNNLTNFQIKPDQLGRPAVYMKSRMKPGGMLPLTWWEKKEYSATDHGTNLLNNMFGEIPEFVFPKSIFLVEDCLRVTNLATNEIVIDFFAGSGTTAHAVMNLNRADGGRRKYILVEMGEHFETVILPRIKKIAFCSKWKDGRPVFDKGESGQSHFVKVFALEQYEDALRRARYEDADLFDNPHEDAYHRYIFLRDLKLLEAVEVDSEANIVRFHPERLYSDIDLAETLSHLRGKWIKRITTESVEFQDGEKISLADPDWRLIKPLIWW